MSIELNQRVKTLEKQVADLSRLVMGEMPFNRLLALEAQVAAMCAAQLKQLPRKPGRPAKNG